MTDWDHLVIYLFLVLLDVVHYTVINSSCTAHPVPPYVLLDVKKSVERESFVPGQFGLRKCKKM